MFCFPLAVILFNEYLIYFLSFWKCSWPAENRTNILIIADTHLLGIYKGNFLDKLKRFLIVLNLKINNFFYREWQMYRSFQTAMTIFKPQAVFFLGIFF